MEDSFKHFFLAYKDHVFKYAFMHFRQEDLAADMVQESFSRLWKKWPSLQKDKNIKSYLYTTCRNLVFDELRKQKLRDGYIDSQLFQGVYEQNSCEEHIDYKDLEQVYRQAIGQMPPARREVFLLSKEEFLSNEAIAERLGISVNTVRDQLVKGNKSVRNYILHHFKETVALMIFLKIF